MNNTFLEQFYENVILPRYKDKVKLDGIKWIDHGKIGLDAWAHHFESNDVEYVLTYEDFPGNLDFDDNLSHDVVKCGNESSIELRFSDNTSLIPNITGWYTLYAEKPHVP